MEVEPTKPNAIAFLSQQLGRPVSEPAFRRWRSAIGIKPKSHYSRLDLWRLWFVGDYLGGDRNLDRAVAAMNRKLLELMEIQTNEL